MSTLACNIIKFAVVVQHTVRNLHFFNFDFQRKLSIFLGEKLVKMLWFLAVDNFDFTRKNIKKKLGEKLVKMLGFCQNWQKKY